MIILLVVSLPQVKCSANRSQVRARNDARAATQRRAVLDRYQEWNEIEMADDMLRPW
ncbi:hypothetical protein [Bradyrhizobium sp. CCGB20]|uniref:hypothetical protein n=1 Tax=Bradyrhizobium sp. CCGB20 TaxID=2949633 RepID=UPI0020B27CEE|nr:hypothetical protein [Bradyrhizobium sp. CCGB20]MCP3398300.1 hypothetical protein [Bradyrhizobium sp. CCGB20]